MGNVDKAMKMAQFKARCDGMGRLRRINQKVGAAERRRFAVRLDRTVVS